MKTGIIGYGSMGRMLLHKFAQSGIGRENLFVSNRTREKLADAEDIAVVCTNTEAARQSDILFLCVRPSDMKDIIEETAPYLKDNTLLVSLNGSISFDTIASVCRHRTAKVIPSVTAEINRSQTLVCYNDLVTDTDRQALTQLLHVIGDVTELPENEMGMGSELCSCMPGFIASIFDVICLSAQKHTAIPREQIVKMVLSTMTATGELMLGKDMSFADVVGRVATKGGITEVGSQVIYDLFPAAADRMFEDTLEKRRITAEKAAEMFGQ